MRPKGVVVTLPDKEPTGSLYLEAKRRLKEREQRLAADRARRAAIPVPNYKCYPAAFVGRIDDKGNWLPGVSRKVPKCRVCEGLLHPNENHVCTGFVPKYVEHDDEWRERQDEKQLEIRVSKERELISCAGCHETIHDLDEARWHDEHCGQGWEQDKTIL